MQYNTGKMTDQTSRAMPQANAPMPDAFYRNYLENYMNQDAGRRQRAADQAMDLLANLEFSKVAPTDRQGNINQEIEANRLGRTPSGTFQNASGSLPFMPDFQSQYYPSSKPASTDDGQFVVGTSSPDQARTASRVKMAAMRRMMEGMGR